ncbi:MAG: bifunctional UDP-N-acetylglucosamine diphosphorylase/glucosamine-1-phosphate N-acetyltransferase GlmU [Geminicoccaceae bacterium]|nr:bifunctional UDP-N-acetylglucosamine diphosphorylase/glucosamine-1-phosphate N-acetyltransferase GlmU [Geminicoccaceae bacterium]
MSVGLLSAVVLAAGKGTRMRAPLPKVLHPLAGRPLIGHVLKLTQDLGCERTVLVLAPGMETVENVAREIDPELRIAIQDPPLGTGHAVAAAMGGLEGRGTVLVLFGDTPLLLEDTVRRLVAARELHGAAVAVLGMNPPANDGYGRLRIGDDGHLVEIVEHRHADEKLRREGLCNSGVMAIDGALLRELVEAIELQPEKNEYYLTDIVTLAVRRGYNCVSLEGPWQEGHGVNSQAQLAEAEAIWQNRRRTELMDAGVIMPAPETVWLCADVDICAGAVIEPNVVFAGRAQVGEGARIRAFSHVEDADIGPGAIVGPYARLRPGSRLAADVHVGNFVEIKNAELGPGAKANHLTYLGDCSVGGGSNIGAGTITCNYDGFGKHRTELGERVFIGSNSALVAPVSIGDGAIVGAGSVITRNVPAGAVALTRSPQNVHEGAAEPLRQKLRKTRNARKRG